MPRPKNPKAPTAAERQAAVAARLEKVGGKRLTIKLQAAQVRKLQKLIKAGIGANQQDVIQKLIDAA